MKRICTRALMSAFLVHAGIAAAAGDWAPVAVASNGAQYSFQPDKVQQYAPTVARAWVKVDSRLAEPKQKYTTAMLRYDFNCKESTVRLISFIGYGADDEVLERQDAPLAPSRAIVPETVQEEMITPICAAAARNGAKK